MVGRDYMVDTPPPPPAWRRAIDLRVIPRAANMLGTAEGLLEHVAVQARAWPMLAVSAAFGAGCVVAMLLVRSRA